MAGGCHSGSSLGKPGDNAFSAARPAHKPPVICSTEAAVGRELGQKFSTKQLVRSFNMFTSLRQTNSARSIIVAAGARRRINRAAEVSIRHAA
jgi:hypothetical protein